MELDESRGGTQRERESLIEEVRMAEQQIKLRDLILAWFIPPEFLEAIEQRMYPNPQDESGESWLVQGMEVCGNAVREAEREQEEQVGPTAAYSRPASSCKQESVATLPAGGWPGGAGRPSGSWGLLGGWGRERRPRLLLLQGGQGGGRARGRPEERGEGGSDVHPPANVRKEDCRAAQHGQQERQCRWAAGDCHPQAHRRVRPLDPGRLRDDTQTPGPRQAVAVGLKRLLVAMRGYACCGREVSGPRARPQVGPGQISTATASLP